MPDLTLQVTQKLPTLTGDVRRIVTDNTDYTARFTFDSGWGEGIKIYFFVLADGTTLTPVVSADTVISLPRLPAGSSGWLYLGVQQGNMVTTRACAIPVLPSIMAALPDPPVPPPEPDVYAQIIALINQLPNALDAAESSASYAAASAESATAAANSAAAAAESANDAADSADDASATVAAAAAFAQAAELSAEAAADAAAGMAYVSFKIAETGHVLIENAQRLATTSFAIINGHMEVTI